MTSEARTALRVPGSLEGIRQVAAGVDAFGSQHGLPRQVVADVQVALDEVLSNIVRHGYGAGEEGRIEVSLLLRSEWLELVVVDDAGPFNPLQVPAADTESPLEQRRPGGLGVMLVKKLMDAVEYERSEERNRLRLSKRARLTAEPRRPAD